MISRKQQLSPVVIIILESSPQSDPVSRSLAMYPTLYVGVYTRDTVNTTNLCDLDLDLDCNYLRF